MWNEVIHNALFFLNGCLDFATPHGRKNPFRGLSCASWHFCSLQDWLLTRFICCSLWVFSVSFHMPSRILHCIYSWSGLKKAALNEFPGTGRFPACRFGDSRWWRHRVWVMTPCPKLRGVRAISNRSRNGRVHRSPFRTLSIASEIRHGPSAHFSPSAMWVVLTPGVRSRNS